MSNWTCPDPAAGRCRLNPRTYALGVLAVFACAYSQYLLPGLGPIMGAFLVYGVSIAVLGVIYGGPILRRALRRPLIAFRLGLGSFGVLTVLSGLASLLIILLLVDVDPHALRALHRPVPVLRIPEELAWVMVWASVLVVGPCEEFIFRGFVFGGLLNLFRGRHWFLLAVLSSLLFAAVHLYYALTYGVASVIPYLDIVSIGLALSIAYYFSGGNLLVPALIHGLYDSTGFMAVAVDPEVGARLRGLLVMAGLVVAAVTAFDSYRRRSWRF